MKRNVLVAVDDSFHSKNCIRYMSMLVQIVQDLHFTCVHVQKGVSQFLLEEEKRQPKAKIELKKLRQRNRAAAEKLLAEVREQMAASGITPGRIHTQAPEKNLGLAKDLIELAQEGHFDAIAAGRRGLTGVSAVLLESLTAKLVEHASVVPVWIIDGEVPNTRILLAADGSESSFRALDHLCFMVGDNPEAQLTLFHVTPRIGEYCRIDFTEPDPEIENFIVESDKRCLANFYDHAAKACRKAGITEDRIEIKQSRKRVGVGKAIVEEARKGDYGTVVLGRRGTGRSFFMGSVSRYVLSKADNRAVWLVP
jgi:nucleotide-binding universal stress UspA family protein